MRKNRRVVVVAFLLCAALLLGVGYATLTDLLEINGSAEVNQEAAQKAFDADVYFKSAVADNDLDEAYVLTEDNDKAGFKLHSLSGQGDKAVITFTIVNTGDVNAIVTPTLVSEGGNTNPEYFKVSSNWAGATQELPAGGTIVYELTVELLKTPTNVVSGTFHVQLTATSVDAAPETTTVAGE